MRYRDRKRAEALWAKHYGVLQAILCAPSKAIVFSDIYDQERAQDTSHFIDPMRNLRSFNPLDRSKLVFRTDDSIIEWAKSWKCYLEKNPIR